MYVLRGSYSFLLFQAVSRGQHSCIVPNVCRTPSHVIELNRYKLHRTKLPCNRPPYAKRFICDGCELTATKNTPTTVIIEKYLASHDTTRPFDWLYILPTNNKLQGD